jgi:hypothetical protein
MELVRLITIFGTCFTSKLTDIIGPPGALPSLLLITNLLKPSGNFTYDQV